MIYLSRFEKTNKDLTIQANILYNKYLSNMERNNTELANKFLIAYKDTLGLINQKKNIKQIKQTGV